MKWKFRSMVHYSWRWKKKQKIFHHYSPFMLQKKFALIPATKSFSHPLLRLMNRIKQNNSFSRLATVNCSQLMQQCWKTFRICSNEHSFYANEMKRIPNKASLWELKWPFVWIMNWQIKNFSQRTFPSVLVSSFNYYALMPLCMLNVHSSPFYSNLTLWLLSCSSSDDVMSASVSTWFTPPARSESM